MALGTTDITMTQVATALSVSTSDIDLKNLCTHANVNPWSRYKPGYLESDGTGDKFLVYQEPQGGGSTDPRGTDSDVGHDLETYKLGDFRGYNQSATEPYVNFPTGVIEFGYGTSTSSGISRPFYAEEVDWVNTGVYRSTNNWPTVTHVHLLDADDDSIVGTAALPAIGGNVDIDLDGVTLPAGVQVDKTYHLAFGVDSTHWSFKLGSNYGAGGIGVVSMIQLNQAQIYHVQFDDSSITGYLNPPYSSMEVITPANNDNRFSGNTAIWDYTDLNGFRAYYDGGASYDDCRNITADWYIKGFIENPATEYQAKSSSSFASNGANNTVDLSSMIDSPPRGYWSDGDEITLILRNISINY